MLFDKNICIEEYTCLYIKVLVELNVKEVVDW